MLKLASWVATNCCCPVFSPVKRLLLCGGTSLWTFLQVLPSSDGKGTFSLFFCDFSTDCCADAAQAVSRYC